jgi:hypothetical protein
MVLKIYYQSFSIHGHLPEEALIIDLPVLRLIVQQAQNRDDAQRPEDETDYAVEPTDPHVLREVVFFQARLQRSILV